jgi:hypothetical protein
MKGTKLLFLILALILPVGIFVFLKLFGKNEFDVPVLHADSVEAPVDCPFNYSAPYVIHDSIAARLKINSADSLYVIYFDPSLRVQAQRVSVEFNNASIRIISTAELSVLDTDPEILRKCILLMPASSSMVLVDHRRRIRGYYDGSDRDEIDRLIVEIKIILKEY